MRRYGCRVRPDGRRAAGVVDSRGRLAPLPGVHRGGFASRAV